MVESYIDAHDEGAFGGGDHYEGYYAAKAKVVVPLDSVDSSLKGITLQIDLWSNRQYTHTLKGNDDPIGVPEMFKVFCYSPELTYDNSDYSVKISDSQSGLSGTHLRIEAGPPAAIQGSNSDEKVGIPIITKEEQYYSGSGTLTVTLIKNTKN